MAAKSRRLPTCRLTASHPLTTRRPMTSRSIPANPKARAAMAERVGVYPGTFDPITNGHQDIIQRAARMVDRLIVAVAVNAGKGPMFSLEKRLAMVRDDVAALPVNGTKIEAVTFDTLLINFVR